MIGHLKGKVVNKYDNSIFLDVNGVGWEVNVGSKFYSIDQEIELYIHTQVKENEISLWGFETFDSLKLFKKLINVSGIGGKTGMTLISVKGVEGITTAILDESAKDLKVPGIGSKTSEKIILELRGKLSGFTNYQKENKQISTSFDFDEVIEALTSLGYTEKSIREAFAKLDKDEDVAKLDISELVRLMLRYL